MRYYLTLMLLITVFCATGQNYSLTGNVFNEKGEPMVYSTVVLLNPADSIMEFFGIADKQGHFDIQNIKKGEYLLQAAFLGYETFYKGIIIPEKEHSKELIVMKPSPVGIDEIKVVGEHVPFWIKKDTIEYNVKAFKTKPGAIVEELLKKLPGVEVDRAGNIKAQGENVNKVYVDGKEFFGNDPKVATKNVPVDALDRVQVFDKKSDESEFMGIDDGTRSKVINLMLKEDKKNALFGSATAGGGTDERYKGGVKAYHFTNKAQIAALGRTNNINESGFSGSMSSMGGGGITIINKYGSFGQPVSGEITSRSGGLNFSYAPKKQNRVFMSYLGNSTKSNLEEVETSRNYTESDEFLQESVLNENNNNKSHRFNFGIRSRIDSTQNIILNGDVSLNYGDMRRDIFSESYTDETLVNELTGNSYNDADNTSGKVSGSYTKKFNRGKTIFKLAGGADWESGKNNLQFENNTRFIAPVEEILEHQFRDNETKTTDYSVTASLSQQLGKRTFLSPKISMGNTIESLERTQGNIAPSKMIIDSLSPDFERQYQWIKPKLVFNYDTRKTNLALRLQFEAGKLETTLNGENGNKRDFFYFTPYARYEYRYRSGRSIRATYSSFINTPSASHLLPVVDNTNPLAIYYGNPDLKPEYLHQVDLNWHVFDQFSFTSFLLSLKGGLTTDKINWSRIINDNLGYESTPVNVDNTYNAGSSMEFSTPIRPLGIKIKMKWDENWNRGTSFINTIENEYTNLSHRFSVTLDNRKKEKWDISSGVNATLTNSWYSLQESLNNRYFNISWFGELRYTPNDDWNFEVIADVNNYSAKSFDQSISIPLIGAEVNHYFLKNNKGTLTLKAVDLLNKNTNVQRFSELNYLREIRSNGIGRYVMLSFTYRFNKFGL